MWMNTPMTVKLWVLLSFGAIVLVMGIMMGGQVFKLWPRHPAPLTEQVVLEQRVNVVEFREKIVIREKSSTRTTATEDRVIEEPVLLGENKDGSPIIAYKTERYSLGVTGETKTERDEERATLKANKEIVTREERQTTTSQSSYQVGIGIADDWALTAARKCLVSGGMGCLDLFTLTLSMRLATLPAWGTLTAGTKGIGLGVQFEF